MPSRRCPAERPLAEPPSRLSRDDPPAPPGRWRPRAAAARAPSGGAAAPPRAVVLSRGAQLLVRDACPPRLSLAAAATAPLRSARRSPSPDARAALAAAGARRRRGGGASAPAHDRGGNLPAQVPRVGSRARRRPILGRDTSRTPCSRGVVQSPRARGNSLAGASISAAARRAEEPLRGRTYNMKARQRGAAGADRSARRRRPRSSRPLAALLAASEFKRWRSPRSPPRAGARRVRGACARRLVVAALVAQG